MAEVIGAQLVIEALRHEGMDTVYVLPGDPVGTIVVADGASTMDISRQVVCSYKPRHRIDAEIYGCVGTCAPSSSRRKSASLISRSSA
jgi:thiamine pyrophosphate-dependent acetolactate synthase large subunit-like protein